MTLYWSMLAIAITASMAGQSLLKSGAGEASFVAQLFHLHTILGLTFYGAGAVFYIIALRKIPMSVALPCTAASYVAAMLIGHFVFAEPIGVMHLGAMALISAGVVLLAFA